MLPRKLPHVPLFFTDRELELLRGTETLEMIRRRRDQLLFEYAHLCEHVSGIDDFTADQYLLARAIVDSRLFGITVFGEETLALVPLADLVDHHPSPGTAWTFESSRASFILGATEPLPRGSMIRDTYGVKSNASLLTFYGFCLEQNEADTAVLRIDGREHTVTADLHADAVRAMFAELSGKHDDAAPAVLLEACTSALRQFPTTLDQDQALLANKRLSRNSRNAILARMSEKRVLDFFAKFAQEPSALDTIFPLRRFRDRQWPAHQG